MSGGYWNYYNDTLASEILGYHISADLGLDSAKHSDYFKAVIRENPLDDPEISALVFDVFCLLHSYDWAVSGDTDIERYREDVSIFKERWLKKSRTDQIREIVDISTEKLKEELYRAFECEPKVDNKE